MELRSRRSALVTDPVTAVASTSPAIEVLVTAGIGLLGVVMGGLIQMWSADLVASRQRRDRLKDEKADRDRQAEKLDADRKYLRAVLARQLEAYARACAQVMWDNDDEERSSASALPDFPDWPTDVAWELLGPNEMMTIRDIEVRVDIQREHVKGAVWYGANDEDDARSYYKDGAARIGLDAWLVSKELRQKAGVDPFEFPKEGGNFAESLAEHAAKLDEVERVFREKQQAAIDAAEGDDTP